MSAVGEWLDALGLGEYTVVFEENAIEWEVLPELTEGHLKEMGVPLGHRLRLLKGHLGLAFRKAHHTRRRLQSPRTAPA